MSSCRLRTEVWSGSADGIVFLLIAFFIATKAMTTFSFLFGLGFSIQMMRAEARGRSIAGHHSRRLAVLLLIGAFHAVFLWYGDILSLYALLGFGLLLFRKRSGTTLLVWSTVFVFVLPILLVGRVGPLFGLLVALAVFPVQMAWSAWWLARFRFGPMEWVWRSAVYGQLQPMRIAPAVAPGVQVGTS